MFNGTGHVPLLLKQGVQYVQQHNSLACFSGVPAKTACKNHSSCRTQMTGRQRLQRVNLLLSQCCKYEPSTATTVYTCHFDEVECVPFHTGAGTRMSGTLQMPQTAAQLLTQCPAQTQSMQHLHMLDNKSTSTASTNKWERGQIQHLRTFHDQRPPATDHSTQ